jgi:hypothetical protein
MAVHTFTAVVKLKFSFGYLDTSRIAIAVAFMLGEHAGGLSALYLVPGGIMFELFIEQDDPSDVIELRMKELLDGRLIEKEIHSIAEHEPDHHDAQAARFRVLAGWFTVDRADRRIAQQETDSEPEQVDPKVAEARRLVNESFNGFRTSVELEKSSQKLSEALAAGQKHVAMLDEIENGGPKTGDGYG